MGQRKDSEQSREGKTLPARALFLPWQERLSSSTSVRPASITFWAGEVAQWGGVLVMKVGRPEFGFQTYIMLGLVTRLYSQLWGLEMVGFSDQPD